VPESKFRACDGNFDDEIRVMVMRFVLGCLIGVVPLLAGCGTENETKPKFDGPPETGDASVMLQVDRGRDSLIGKWQMVMFVPQPPEGYPGPESLCVLDFQKDESGKLAATVIASLPGTEKPQLTTAKLDQDRVTFEMAIGTVQFEFQGVQQGDRVRGNVVVNKVECVTAVLIATSAKAVAEPNPLPGENEFKDAVQSSEPDVKLREFARQFPENPLSLAALERVLSGGRRDSLSEDEFGQLADEYFKMARRWGPLLERHAQLNVALNLAANEYHPHLVLQYLKQIESNLQDGEAPNIRQVVDQARQGVDSLLAIELLKAEDASQRQQGLEQLEKLLATDPFNFLVLYEVAEYARKQGRVDEAIDMLARIVALPMMEQSLAERWASQQEEKPLPNETLAELWTQKHGDKKGLDAFVMAEYAKRIHDFGEAVKPREAADTNQVVFCELFTGAMCPPCVAADVATGGLEANFARSDVIVVRYHQHIPGPDPLVNADAEARFDYYVGEGQASTPALCINGHRVEAGGFLEHARNVYKGLHTIIESLLKQPTDITISAEAAGEAGQLHLKVDVSGRESYAETLRLRLLLVEDGVDFRARNGIRVHDMLVRSMPAGVRGVAVEDGQLRYEGDVDLAALKKEIGDYLTAFEKGREYQFAAKPLELKRLHLVAFVQDDATHSVLQATVVEVTGSLEIPQPEESAK